MLISTKGRYALQMLLDIAVHQDEGFIPLKDIAGRQYISKKYLEHIVPMLSKKGLLRTNKGTRGGYKLTKSTDKYTVGEILRATEANFSSGAKREYLVTDSTKESEQMTMYIWDGLFDVATEYLDSITLQDIINHNAVVSGDNYCI